MILWRQLRDKIRSAELAAEMPLTNRPIIYIDSEQQQLSMVSAKNKLTQAYPVSTSRHGLGQQNGSYQTPAGIHRIAQKIGNYEPAGRVFKARIAQPEICLPKDSLSQEDIITTRILWLEGMQPGINLGGDVDTYNRYIYIHGTTDEAHIGQPASIGCIRMKNLDVIEVFKSIQINDLVIIE